MNDNTNKQRAVNAIWENPAKVFGCSFRRSGNYFENLRGGDYTEPGKIRIAMTQSGANIYVFYNGSSRNERTDVFTYLQDYVLHTAGFKETIKALSELYGFTLEITAQERQTLKLEALAREVAASIVTALGENPTGSAARYVTETRGLALDGRHFGELSEQSIYRIAETLRLHDYDYNPEDLAALGLTLERAKAGYNLAIPYYCDGNVKGFVFRNVNPEHKGPKYLYSTGMERAAYCDRLDNGEPVVFVEGPIDAIRLIQAGVKNVVAMGGAQIAGNTAKLLKGRGISQVTYVPDLEFDESGKQKTHLIAQALQAFQSAKVDDEPVINNLYLAQIQAPEGANLCGLKIDADSYGKEHSPEDVRNLIDQAGPWWGWELRELDKWAADQDSQGSYLVNGFQSRFDAIYKRCATPYERELIKTYITKHSDQYKPFGVTAKALEDVDEWNRNREYTNRVKAAAGDLSQAVENGANPVKVGEAVERLTEAQSSNTRADWEKQLNESFDDELEAIRAQPDTLRTRWELGTINPERKFIRYENIEFWPADITLFCAATSHGKTAVMFQSVMDLLKRDDGKIYLYVSCEENKRQLLERALNVYLDIPTTPDGKDSQGRYCFISQTRKRTIKAVLRGSVPPLEYTEFMGVSDHYNELSREILRGVKTYGEIIRPRLKLIHAEGSAESIAANILYFVRSYMEQGAQIGGVFVDYMQLLSSENKNFSRTDELKDVCRALKGCAAATEVPFIVAAQLNREGIKQGIDAMTEANIGEGADIERIAHDIYFIWQTNKTKVDQYFTWAADKDDNGKTIKGSEKIRVWEAKNAGDRANRIFYHDELYPQKRALKAGYLYIEQLKARDGKAGGWGLFPFDGEQGRIGENDTDAMKM